MKTDTPRPIRLRDYRPSSHLIDRVDLDVSLHPTETIVRSVLRVRPNPAARSSTKLRLDGENLELLDVAIDGEVLSDKRYALTQDSLELRQLPEQPFKLAITTKINPDANKALSGLYRSNGVYCTQCEAEGFRRITYFLDRPDVLSVYRCRVEGDRTQVPVLLSNGNPVERGTCGDRSRHYAVWKDPHPKPSYLFALVGGNLAPVASTFRTASGRHVDLTIYCEPGKEERCAWAMDSLKRSMAWDEERYGREYDLDVFNIVAVSDFNMGAMENKGLNIFNDRLILASPETATDSMFEAIEAVVAHEYFHNWTGNRITCRDWFQLCLKEGLTVYRDQEFTSDERSRPVQRINDVRHLRAYQFAEDAGPLAHPVRPESYIEINNFYTATVYEKGAELVRMIETVLGSDGFAKGMDLYFSRHDGEAATVEDFITCFEDATDISLKQFRLWYSQAGTPELHCALSFDKIKQTAQLTVTQAQPPTPGQEKKKPLHIPLRVGLIARDGSELPLELAGSGPVSDGVLHVTKATQTFKLTNVTQRPVLSALRGFSAPVKNTSPQSDKDLTFLIAYDTDPFARWQSGNDYAMRALIAMARANTMADEHKSRIDAFADALRAPISDTTVSAAYRAELLRLPSELDIAREIRRNVDPDAVHAARRAFQKRLAQQLGEELVALYDDNRVTEAFAPTAEQTGKRSLRNTALALLVARNRKDDRETLAAHYETARNMTDQLQALSLYAVSGNRDRTRVLDDFFAKWRHDHLVVDTWFSVQAIAPASATLGRVKKLTKHPMYSATTPNKIRAVVGVFANQNPVQFHRPDGAGYSFVADQVRAINAFNPQVAARLLGAFSSWRSLEPSRRKHAKAALQTVAGDPTLSRDVFEIATKILDTSAN
ncbi:MAG: aminopeptidase N [Pseudomonadota bacterium]